MNCKYCEHALPAGSNPRRAFCNDAHKQAHWRQQQQQDQNRALRAELSELRIQVRDQAQMIEEQAQEVTRLRSLLDIERRVLSDTSPRGLKSWIKKQPSSPFIQKVLADKDLRTQDTYVHYRYRFRHLLHCSEEELQEFERLWKLMLLSRA